MIWTLWSGMVLLTRMGRSHHQKCLAEYHVSRSHPRRESIETSLSQVTMHALNLLPQVPHKFVDTDYYRPLAACCVQVEPLSSLPVEYASVLTRPCSIVCEVAPIPIQDNDFQIQM
ncbi:hypothetical protein EWB00_002897 [Schistosoma japonicum]|uniref:Uncharacterized protein n=1 Tax=Schistosoma japonicum TaxID=6182 RepID=A0A4Z2DW54_SCHJA|nr:hypothetical protein EWB00_002897 [Schistosoma japonicum]